MSKQTIFINDVFPTQKCGPVKVLDYVNANHILVEFLETGYQMIAQSGHLKRGKLKDPNVASVMKVGRLGIGVYPVSYWNSEKGKAVKHPLYGLWVNMLDRCYNPKYQKTHPTYRGCTVCERWKNYQNFCEDVKKLDGYEEWSDEKMGLSSTVYNLDKDKRVLGNKQYGPSTCCFITEEENVRITREYYANLTKEV